jgi:hypothetical protein
MVSLSPAPAQPLGQATVLVSLSPAPAQAQPLGQAKVAIITDSFSPHLPKIMEAFLGKLIKGTKLGNQQKSSAQSERAQA